MSVYVGVDSTGKRYIAGYDIVRELCGEDFMELHPEAPDELATNRALKNLENELKRRRATATQTIIPTAASILEARGIPAPIAVPSSVSVPAPIAVKPSVPVKSSPTPEPTRVNEVANRRWKEEYFSEPKPPTTTVAVQDANARRAKAESAALFFVASRSRLATTVHP